MTSSSPIPLSPRIISNIVSRSTTDRLTSLPETNPYDPTNGIINLGVAENELPHTLLSSHLCSPALPVDAAALRYSPSSTGSTHLKSALASFTNKYFLPATPTLATEFHVTNGASTAGDQLAWALASDGDAFMIAAPCYNGFVKDWGLRAGVGVAPVYFPDGRAESQFSEPDNTAPYDATLQNYEAGEGGKVRALVVCNPHNPSGRVYSPEVVTTLLRWCAERGIIYISDEIYALSHHHHRPHGYNDRPAARSALSLVDPGSIQEQSLVTLYGFSKDFCANGVRLGHIHTRDVRLLDALSSISRFSWPSSVAENAMVRVLHDEAFMANFLHANAELLAQQCRTAEQILDAADIPCWTRPSAGLFLWVDVRCALHSRGEKTGEEGWVEERELFEWLCAEQKVYVGSGEKFFAQEPGWCRIVFSGEETAVREGLKRFVEGVKKRRLE